MKFNSKIPRPDVQVLHTTGAAASPVRASSGSAARQALLLSTQLFFWPSTQLFFWPSTPNNSQEAALSAFSSAGLRPFAPPRFQPRLSSSFTQKLLERGVPSRSRLHPALRGVRVSSGRQLSIPHRAGPHPKRRETGEGRENPRSFVGCPLHGPYARVLGPFPTRKGS